MRRWSTVASVAVALAVANFAMPIGAQEIPKVVLDAAMSRASAAKMRMLTVPTGEFRCKGPGAGPLPYIKCSDVPVVVLLDPQSSGGCIAIVPYKTLHVYTKKDTTQVIWYLVAPDGYTFDKSKGIAIPSVTGTDYTNKGTSKQDTQFTWEIAKNASQVTYDHVANVKNPNGDPCDPGDPAITNDPN